jgi:hypothetical protein
MDGANDYRIIDLREVSVVASPFLSSHPFLPVISGLDKQIEKILCDGNKNF